MKIGFSGTQYGMTGPQQAAVFLTIDRLAAEVELHHGDCVGADAEMHEQARRLRFRVVIHPPADPKKRAFCRDADEVRPERPYLERNQAIVDACDVLIAAPAGVRPVMRSGTWSTIRRAEKKGIPIFAYGPDGSRLSLDPPPVSATITTMKSGGHA